MNSYGSVYLEEFKYYAEYGMTKELLIPHEEDTDDRLFMRIIGINHDNKADGNGKAGLTFMAANSINKGFTYEVVKELGQVYN